MQIPLTTHTNIRHCRKCNKKFAFNENSLQPQHIEIFLSLAFFASIQLHFITILPIPEYVRGFFSVTMAKEMKREKNWQ